MKTMGSKVLATGFGFALALGGLLTYLLVIPDEANRWDSQKFALVIAALLLLVFPFGLYGVYECLLGRRLRELSRECQPLTSGPESHHDDNAFSESDEVDQILDNIQKILTENRRLRSMLALRDEATSQAGSGSAESDPGEDRNPSKENSGHLALALEQAAEVIIILDPSGIVEYVNPAFTQITGYSRQDTVARNIVQFTDPQRGLEIWNPIWETLHRGEVWKGRMCNLRADESIYRVESTISPVRNAQGQIQQYVIVQHDITQMDELENQLRQMQKMEAVGRLAGGVAHDFNNLLTVILGYTDLLLHRFADDNSVSGELQEIRKASERGSNLTRQLLTFSRHRLIEAQPVDLNETVRDMQKMLLRVIGEDIQLQARLDEDLGKIQVDPGQISQLILNLAINARDAMPRGGRLIVTTSQLHLDADANRGMTQLEQGDYILLSISDTGVGMSPEVQGKIFEPFFTTKEHRGTGLGLSTVYGIVRQAGGDIRVFSRENEGTTFQILFPKLVEEDIETLDFTSPVNQPSGGNETILLVEDEELVRNLIAEILRKNGYQVILAINGRKALEAFAQQQGSIDLLITDIVMPEMGGHDVVNRIRNECPTMRVLYMSGYTEDSVTNIENFGPDIGFIEKPFKSEDFLCKVRVMLEKRPIQLELGRKDSA